jgi:transcriptional regulator with XRE-family HTH domain
MELSSDSYRAARGLLGLTQKVVADAAGVDRRLLMRTEALDCVEVPKNAYLLRIHYESAGLMFLEEEVAAGGEGVRWKVATGYFGYRSQLRADVFLLDGRRRNWPGRAG